MIQAISSDGAALYFSRFARPNILGYQESSGSDNEIQRARPEDGPAETLASVSGDRIPGLPAVANTTVSPDDRWLAMPLVDGATTNLWRLPTAGGAMTPITDFGTRAVEIARSISWSADGRYLYAAVAELEADIVLLDGLIG